VTLSDTDVLVNQMIEANLIHEIHTSERRSFRACRRRWDWLFRLNYYPLVTAKPLEFGTAFHKGMEVFYDPRTWNWDREVVAASAILAFVDKCEEQKLAYLKYEGRTQLDEEVEEDYAARVELGKGMMNWFFLNVSPKEDTNWKPVEVEVAFRVPIRHPETGEKYIWCKCQRCWERVIEVAENIERKDGNRRYTSEQQDSAAAIRAARENNEAMWDGLPVCYEGRLDVLGIDDRGGYWVVDWKTAAAIRGDDEHLYLDDQVGSYVWALWKLNVPVRGFIYHEQKKGYPLPPKENKVRRLGRKFSVAQNQDTDYELYLQTVSEKDTDAWKEGLYDDFLRYLQEEGITYYSRKQIHKSREELESIEYNIGLEALDMIDPKLRIYPSAGRFGCTFCAFRQPCMEKNAHGDYQYALDTMYEQREHYYVREEPSTESKGGE
jgi:hypothetical protein